MSIYRQLSIDSSLGSSSQSNAYDLKRKYRDFVVTVFIVILLLLSLISLFNVGIDPYGIFHSPAIAGINAAKPQKFKHDMLVNAVEVIRQKPETIFLGSSRVQWGLNPHHEGLKKDGKIYNLALQGVNLYQIRRYFEHALYNQPNLRQVILGLDELMFSEFAENRPDFDEQRLEKRHLILRDIANIVFSMDAIVASQSTITTSSGKPTSISVGNFTVKPNIFDQGVLDLDISNPLPGSIQGFKKNLLNRVDLNRDDRRYSVYKFSGEQLDHFKAIVETCQNKGIDLKVFISPEHVTLFEIMNTLRFRPEIETWKQEITKLTPVWDFSGYNSITTEPIRDDMNYYLDSSHYSQSTGQLILNRLLSYQSEWVPDDFGVLVTPENIGSHLAKIRTDREHWAMLNPNLVQLTQTAQMS